MKTSKITLEENGDQLVIKIVGEISSQTQFPSLQLKPNQTKILLLLDEAGYVNSGGIQGWISWLQAVQKSHTDLKFSIQMLPANFAKLSNNIRDFLPRLSKVESFVVPYFCDNCNEGFKVTFKKGSNWETECTGAELIKKISTANCSGCGASSEIDTPVEAYQNF